MQWQRLKPSGGSHKSENLALVDEFDELLSFLQISVLDKQSLSFQKYMCLLRVTSACKKSSGENKYLKKWNNKNAIFSLHVSVTVQSTWITVSYWAKKSLLEKNAARSERKRLLQVAQFLPTYSRFDWFSIRLTSR